MTKLTMVVKEAKKDPKDVVTLKIDHNNSLLFLKHLCEYMLDPSDTMTLLVGGVLSEEKDD